MIYPQHIEGKYRDLKNMSMTIALFVYFIASWITWDRGHELPNQAIFMDIANRKAYIFAIQIWPDELYYITGILILAALGLFIVTSLYGRLWCGYFCPHTVFVDLFVKIEHWIIGDRNARIRFAQLPMNSDKFKKLFIMHSIWLIIGFSFAFGWVCYFYQARDLVNDLLNAKVSTNSALWLIGLTFSTYFFAGFIRQRVCLYMCPYGRFQSAMLEDNTLIVTYHDNRGEPRGKNAEGDCIDCNKCVVVCPMDIDIRNGLQLGCIGCGLCVDACNSVMKKIGKDEDLISYSGLNVVNKKKSRRQLRVKTILFAAIFILVSLGMLYLVTHKSTMRLDVIKDRSSLFTMLKDGYIRNTYSMHIGNRTMEDKEFELYVEGLTDVSIKLQGISEYQKTHEIIAPKGKDFYISLFIKASPQNNNSDIQLILLDKSSGKKYIQNTKFIITLNK